ncbi:MAG: hypothetical protein SNJ63_00140 [Sphingomonadaceae bacterium]
MRLAFGVLVALVLALPALAADGFQAIYAGQDGQPDIHIEVAANGDFRVGPVSGEQYGIGIGEDFFMVAREGRGRTRVFRVQEMAAAMEQVMPPQFKALFAEAAKDMTPGELPKMTRTGSRTIAGFEGEVWRISFGSPPEAREVVLSKDPRLRPIGLAMGKFIESNMLMMAPLVGEAAGGMMKEARQLFALGTPIGGDGGFLLKSAGPAQVPPERLALPARPMTRDELLKNLGRP